MSGCMGWLVQECTDHRGTDFSQPTYSYWEMRTLDGTRTTTAARLASGRCLFKTSTLAGMAVLRSIRLSIQCPTETAPTNRAVDTAMGSVRRRLRVMLRAGRFTSIRES